MKEIIENPNKLYLISKIGSGVANKHDIFKHVIDKFLKVSIEKYSNVKFLW